MSSNTSLLAASLHELAEGLQSTGTYLSAARQILHGAAVTNINMVDVIEKARDELGRAQAAFDDVRRQVLMSKADEVFGSSDDTPPG